MNEKLLSHYKHTGRFTYAGPYKDYLASLPDDITELGNLVCAQILHRITLLEGNTNANADLRYGDMNRYPWHRMRCEDDVFLTSTSMIAELFRMDERGFVEDRAVENKLVLCCRYVSVLMTAILKAKGFAARSRAGYAPYFNNAGISMDHWINQYYDEAAGVWKTFDADGFFKEGELPFKNQYDIPENQFDWAAQSWLKVRRGEIDGKRFIYADGQGTCGLKALVLYLFFDLNAIMNNELTFSFQPEMFVKFNELKEEDFRQIDRVAELMCNPDDNFDELKQIWETDRKWRLFCSPLVGWNEAF